MKKTIALILASKPQYSETFIKEFISGLRKNENIVLDVFVDKKMTIFNIIINIFYLFKIPFFYKRVLNYCSQIDPKLKTKHKIWNLINNLEILTSKRQYDYVHFGFANLIQNRAHLGNAIGARTSISLRGYDITYYPVMHSNFYKSSWKYIDKIQYNSTDLYNWALFWGAGQNIESHLISAAVNDSLIVNIPRKTHDTLKILSVGRLHWKKGFETVIFAINELVKRGFKVKYRIVGDGPELEKLKYLICHFKLNEVIEIIGSLPHGQVISEIDNCDLVVIPSIQEGCSNVALEAQGRGRFCVVSDSEGMNEVVEKNKTGFIFPRNDFNKLAELILEYSIMDDTKKTELSEYSVKRIRTKFSREGQKKKWFNFFLNNVYFSQVR
jgi:colanic acid/amylovoran biosynthesis glycosyltransferase